MQGAMVVRSIGGLDGVVRPGVAENMRIEQCAEAVRIFRGTVVTRPACLTRERFATGVVSVEAGCGLKLPDWYVSGRVQHRLPHR